MILELLISEAPDLQGKQTRRRTCEMDMNRAP